MSIQPSSRFFNGLTEEHKEELERIYSNSKRVIERILEILDRDIQINIEKSESPLSFETENWAEKQSYNFGYRQGIRDIKKLLRKVDHDL